MPTDSIASTAANIYIGVDGGGTQTRAIAIDAEGNELGAGAAAGSNPNNIGFPAAARNILHAIESAGLSVSENASICMGIAGLATKEQQERLRSELIQQLPILEKTKLRLTHDLEIAQEAAFAGQPGIILIAGTGSACYAKTASGETLRASGRDFHYEDPGSGYAIGKRAIDSKLLLAADSRPAIAAIAPRVIELAAEGDLKALDILRLESEHLAKLAKRVYVEFAQTEDFPQLALSGSIVTTESLYRHCVLFELQSALPRITIREASLSPEQAAAQIALRQGSDSQ